MVKPVVHIFILKYKSPSAEALCVSSLLFNTDWPYVLTVFDNRTLNEKNTARLWNDFVENSIEEYVCFLDSDTRPGKHWLDRMMPLFEKPEVGAVVPRTNNCGELRQVQAVDSDSVCFLDWHASGFCFVFPRKVYNAVGRFNEEFGFYGQDSEWFARMYYRSSYRVALQPRSFVEHVGGGSVKTVSDPYDFVKDKEHAHKLFYQHLGKLQGV